MPRASKTPSIQARRIEPEVFIEGVDVIIRLDLGKHKELLAQTQTELLAFREAAAHEIKRKKHYYRLIGGGKYDDDALRSSVKDIRINIQHLTNKAKLAEDKIEHYTLIVDTLTEQLKRYNTVAAAVKRSLNGNASRH